MTGHLRGDARKRSDHHVHPDAGVRDLIERERRAAAVEALLDAADAPWRPEHAAGHNWLRNRADRIEAAS